MIKLLLIVNGMIVLAVLMAMWGEARYRRSWAIVDVPVDENGVPYGPVGIVFSDPEVDA